MFRKIQHNPKVLHRVICNVQFSTPNYYTCKEKTNVIHEKGEKKIRQEKLQTNPDIGFTKDFKAAVIKKTMNKQGNKTETWKRYVKKKRKSLRFKSS